MQQSEVRITYEIIYDVFRNEKIREELQKLEPRFLEDVKEYLDEKNSILKSQMGKKSIFSSSETQKTIKQIESVHKMLKELQERREAKIIELAMFSSRTGQLIKEIAHMLSREQDFFHGVLELLNKNRNALVEFITADAQPKDLKKANPNERRKVIFQEDVQEFVGADLQVYGPYHVHDIAELPTDIAHLLVKKEKALLEE